MDIKTLSKCSSDRWIVIIAMVLEAAFFSWFGESRDLEGAPFLLQVLLALLLEVLLDPSLLL